MKEERKPGWKEVLIFLASAAGLTILAMTGIFYKAEQTLADAWYQESRALDGNIVLVGIDQKALDAIGPYQQWDRNVIAETVEILNQSPECHPAVICLDVLYTGETEPGADKRLAQAAGEYGNVVTACAAEFGNSLVLRADGEYDVDRFAVLTVDEPYEELRLAAHLGHINAMMDDDGILRHHLLEVRPAGASAVPSLALTAARLYKESLGEQLSELPKTDARGFWYLPFCGKPGHFGRVVSVADVLSGEAAPEYFDGKIVMIGPYTAGLQDSYLTSADHAKPMYGIEFQANALHTLLEGEFKQEAGPKGQLMLLFMVLLAAAAVFWKRPAGVSTAVWLLVSGGYLALCRWFYDRGVVLNVLWIPAGLTVLYAGSLAYNYVQAALEKQRVTKTFKRYVAPEIVNELMKNETEAMELGGKLRTIAVLFVDIRGFTSMSEVLKPTQVVGILNQYLTLVSKCILKNGGTLDKFVGDAAMAFWGAPLSLPVEEAVMKAAVTAMDMVKGSEKLSRELMKKYKRTVAFGIGIHVGEAVVGNIGSPRRMDYTAIGDTVNTAARLEANAPKGMIYISRAVADILGDRAWCTSLGDSVKLKGKADGFEVLTLDRLRKP